MVRGGRWGEGGGLISFRFRQLCVCVKNEFYL